MLCTTNNSKYTNIKNLEKIAERNFKKHISLNFYPGRGIVVGKNRDNSWILIYWIMGRSSQSRNRIFKYEKGILFTESIGTNLYNDSNFVIYNAMRDLDEGIVVTNGSHTDKIYEGIRQGKSFLKSLESEKHESDSPNYTPRIACFLEKLESRLSMIKICKSDFTINYSSHHYFRYSLIQSGFGYCLSTYMNDGNPPTCFTGDPLLIPIDGNADEIAKKYWNTLNPDNRVAIFAREITILGNDNFKIINRLG